jgi:hexosaminidase
VYRYNPIPGVLTAADARNIPRAQANIRTELMVTPEHPGYIVYLCVPALAEICRMPLSGKDITSFEKRVRQQYQWLRLWAVNADHCPAHLLRISVDGSPSKKNILSFFCLI